MLVSYCGMLRGLRGTLGWEFVSNSQDASFSFFSFSRRVGNSPQHPAKVRKPRLFQAFSCRTPKATPRKRPRKHPASPPANLPQRSLGLPGKVVEAVAT